MSEIVLILGAGTSAEAGAPLMKDFLKTADRLRERNEVAGFKEDFDLVSGLIDDLQNAHSKAQLELENIESVFATLEMGQLTGRLLARSTEQIERLLVAAKRVITVTLERSLTFPLTQAGPTPSDYHDCFGELIRVLNREPGKPRCSIITFNYDLAIDFALHHNSVKFDYGLQGKLKPQHTPLLKLHGSLNWLYCSECGWIEPLDLQPFLRARGTTGGKFILDVGSAALPAIAEKRRHCGKPVEDVPLIVPPTWNKVAYSGRFGTVWAHAARELSTATRIFVSGFSLVETDLFLKYLYTVGSTGGPRLRRFCVYDPDPEVHRRFSELLGPGVAPNYSPQPLNFSNAVPCIAVELDLGDDIVKRVTPGYPRT